MYEACLIYNLLGNWWIYMEADHLNIMNFVTMPPWSISFSTITVYVLGRLVKYQIWCNMKLQLACQTQVTFGQTSNCSSLSSYLIHMSFHRLAPPLLDIKLLQSILELCFTSYFYRLAYFQPTNCTTSSARSRLPYGSEVTQSACCMHNNLLITLIFANQFFH